jgi:hypothetical protein
MSPSKAGTSTSSGDASSRRSLPGSSRSCCATTCDVLRCSTSVPGEGSSSRLWRRCRPRRSRRRPTGPNVPIARRRLAPLGVRVFDTTESGDEPLPFTDGTFDLVVSRHESYAPSEVRRVLVSGGTFVTQQVGGRDLEELNHALGAPPHTYRQWNLAAATDELERAGFEVLEWREELLPGTFYDIGAVVLYLRIIPWQIPGFDLADYDQTLRSLHAMMESGTPLKVNGHRFLVIARSTSDVMAGKQEKECR